MERTNGAWPGDAASYLKVTLTRSPRALIITSRAQARAVFLKARRLYPIDRKGLKVI